MWVSNFYLFKIVNSFLLDLASPKNPLWWWNFGFMLGTFMVAQTSSGLILASFYRDYMNYAFISVEYIMNEINLGYAFRFTHSSGASILFFTVSVHIGRSIWYKSFFISEVWLIGVVIFLVLMMISFLGYVSPWGQMSFWAATVITNLLHVVPYFGEGLLEWAWGGSSVGGPTLSRFPVPHYTMPFVVLMLSITHLVFLHIGGSSNPVGLVTANDKIELFWHYTVKDSSLTLLMFLTFIYMFFLIPYTFMDAENFLVVDFMKTPEHIKPERYFLFAYCILRSVPNKLGGVLGLVSSIVTLFLIPSPSFSLNKLNDSVMGIFKVLWLFSFIILTWLGGCIVDWPFSSLGIIFSALYFILFFWSYPLLRK